MSMPSLDPVTPMEMAQQPVPPLQPLPSVTPMDTTPAPANTITTNLTGNIITATTPSTNIVTGTLNVAAPPAATVPSIVNKPVVVPATTTPVLNMSTPTNHSAATTRNTNPTSVASTAASSSTHEPSQILSRARLQELVREVDPAEQLDEEVEELLLQLADDFVENAVNAACLFAKHRRANTIDVKDVQLHLERNWNMWIPGFGTDELRPYKRAAITEAHKQRLALIRKALKKY